MKNKFNQKNRFYDKTNPDLRLNAVWDDAVCVLFYLLIHILRKDLFDFFILIKKK